MPKPRAGRRTALAPHNTLDGNGIKAGTFEGSYLVAGAGDDKRAGPLAGSSDMRGLFGKRITRRTELSDLSASDRLRRITSRQPRIGVSPDDAIRGYPLVLVHGLLGGLQQLVNAYRK